MSYFIYLDGIERFKVQNSSSDASFSFDAMVGVGTGIDFAVGEHFVNGNAPLHAAINATTAVPLPSTLLLLGPSLVGLAAFRRRFKG